MADEIKITQISIVDKPIESEEEVSGLANQLDLKVHNQFLETKFDANAPIYVTAEVTPITKSVMSKTSDMQEIENHLFDKLDALLAEEDPDYSLIMDEIYKIISVISRNSEKMDREAVQVRIKLMFDKVRDIQGTYNSKKGIALAVTCAVLLFASGVFSAGAGVCGVRTALGKGLPLFLATDGVKTLSNFGQGASSFSQIPSTFMKLDEEGRQSIRQGLQAEQEEVRRKLTQDQESGQRKKSQQDKAVQNLKDTIEKWDRTFSEFTK